MKTKFIILNRRSQLSCSNKLDGGMGNILFLILSCFITSRYRIFSGEFADTNACALA